MESYQDRVAKMLTELKDTIDYNFDHTKIEGMNVFVQNFAAALKNITANVSLQFFTDEMKNYIEETKESEKLSQEEFEQKYSYEMEICKKLGRAGWVISEHSNPREIEEWYECICNGEVYKIESYFDGDNGCILYNIISGLEQKYNESPHQRHFSKGKYYFEQEDYITSAMHLVAVIDARISELMKYPRGTKNKEKYSRKGFESHLQTEYVKTNTFLTKRFLFLEMYPSIVEFLNRLFVDGEYTFENGVEPPYINRNWLLHGKSCRDIERFECVQLFNALSVIEFVFSLSNRVEE